MDYWFVVEIDGPTLWLVAVAETEGEAHEAKERVARERPQARLSIYRENVPPRQSPAKEFKRTNRIGTIGRNSGRSLRRKTAARRMRLTRRTTGIRGRRNL